MKTLTISITAAALTFAGATAALATELPSYEAGGIPVSPMQVSVLGAGHVEQQVTASAVSATPVQISVLTPRKVKSATATTGTAR